MTQWWRVRSSCAESDSLLTRYWKISPSPVVAGPSCDCRCGFDCLECEPPLYQEAEVEPGGHFDFAWSGRVRVPEGHCFHPYGAPTGPRTFEACLGDFGTQPRDCVRVDTELPTDSPIEFHFGALGAAEPAAP